MKHSFFQAVVVLILLYGCTTWTLTKWLEKKLDGNYTRMLRAILNKFWRQHPTRHQLYGHLPPIRKTIKVRQSRHAGHCWRSRDELISDVLLWTPTYGRAKTGRQQLCKDTGCRKAEFKPVKIHIKVNLVSHLACARWLVGWVLWQINLCRLFNAKSFFIQIVSSISNNSV